MFKIRRKKLLPLTLIGTFLFVSSSWICAAVAGQGNLKGFVYSEDSITPVADAFLLLRNIKNGTTYESDKTDIKGLFVLNDIEPGLYLAGIITEAGAYNFERFIGIKPDTTGYVSFALREEKTDDNNMVLGLFTPATGLAILTTATVGTAIAFVIPRSEVKIKEASPFK